MAKHFIKDKDGHFMELSDEEYSSRKKRNGCLSIIGIGFFILIAAIGGGDKDSKEKENSQSTPIRKETNSIDKYTSSQSEEKKGSTINDIIAEEKSVSNENVDSAEKITGQDDNYETNTPIIEAYNDEPSDDPNDEL